MKGLTACVMAVVISLGLCGCLGDMRTVVALDKNNAASPSLAQAQTITVTEKGTYYLFAGSDEKNPIYKTEMKKGGTLGFEASGDRAKAVANGIRVELSDYAEGESYQWKIEEKK